MSTLNELIAFLEKLPPISSISYGFGSAHSYRGNFAQVAFSPEENCTVESMLEQARSALGSTFEGYKGGLYRIDGDTDCYIAEYGETGERIGRTIMAYWHAEAHDDYNSAKRP